MFNKVNDSSGRFIISLTLSNIEITLTPTYTINMSSSRRQLPKTRQSLTTGINCLTCKNGENYDYCNLSKCINPF